jgi:hypothetical protein
MADFYLDHGAYGLASNRIGLDAPTTWGVPQEGDGGDTAASTAASVAEILINAVPTASETIVIAGATITAAAALGANTFARGATTADTATNIVALINHASNFTNTVGTSVVRTTGITTNANQGRNLFYARVKPTQSSTVQIMFRIGSTALNHANNTNVAITTSGWGTAPTITQFAGGVSGCFGWFINPAALGQSSSIAALNYGLMMAQPTVVKSGTSSIYTILSTDKCYIRTGAGQQVNISMGAEARRNSNAGGYHFVFDTNTKWTGDSGNGVFEFKISNWSTFGLTFSAWVSSDRHRWTALKKGNAKITSYTTGASTTAVGSYNSIVAQVLMEGVCFEEDPSGTAGFAGPNGGGNLSLSMNVVDCIFNFLRPSSVGRTLWPTASIGYNKYYFIKNCEFNFNYTGVAAPTVGIITLTGATNSFDTTVIVSGGIITGLGAYTQPIFSLSTGWTFYDSAKYRLIAEGVSGADVGVNGLAPWADYAGGRSPADRTVFVASPAIGGSWRLETSVGAADWIYGGGFPTLGGLTLGGIAHSVRAFWLPTTGQGGLSGFAVPTLRQQNRASSGAKTIALEMLVPSAITYDAFNIRFDLLYVDTNGVVRRETKRGDSVAASAQTWTNAASYPNHTAKKVTFTTDYPVAQYSDVCLDVTLMGPCPTGSLAYLFLDPGFSIT